MSASHYETSNVYLASFLLCSGAVFIGFERVSERRFLFRFRADEKLHELLRLYWKNTEVPLIPAKLFGCLRRLKGVVRGSPASQTAGRGESGANASNRAAPAISNSPRSNAEH